MKKALQFLAVMFGIMLCYTLLLNSHELRRLYHLYYLFEEKNISENFRNMNRFFPSREVSAVSSSETPHLFVKPDNNSYQVPASFVFKEHDVSTDYFLRYTNTQAFLVLHEGELVHEQYFGDATAEDMFIGWSISKSVLSTLVGIAIEDGLLTTSDLVIQHLPELRETAYAETTVEQLLHMTSGVVFNEDYDNFFSDINIFSYFLALGLPMADYVQMVKENDHPGEHRYATIDSQVLGMLLVKVTGKSVSDYLSEKIWLPLGMEKAGFWIADASGMEFAGGGMNASARDFARFGLLIEQDGNWQGKQIVPTDWLARIGNEQHTVTSNENTTYDYSYRWWIPKNTTGNEILAIGVYDQYIYINRDKNIVIVKLSANANYLKDNYISEEQSLPFFRKIAEQF